MKKFIPYHQIVYSPKTGLKQLAHIRQYPMTTLLIF